MSKYSMPYVCVRIYRISIRYLDKYSGEAICIVNRKRQVGRAENGNEKYVEELGRNTTFVVARACAYSHSVLSQKMCAHHRSCFPEWYSIYFHQCTIVCLQAHERIYVDRCSSTICICFVNLNRDFEKTRKRSFGSCFIPLDPIFCDRFSFCRRRHTVYVHLRLYVCVFVRVSGSSVSSLFSHYLFLWSLCEAMFFKSASEITAYTQTCTRTRTKTHRHSTFLYMFWSTAFYVGQLRLHILLLCPSLLLDIIYLFIADAFFLFWQLNR